MHKLFIYYWTTSVAYVNVNMSLVNEFYYWNIPNNYFANHNSFSTEIFGIIVLSTFFGLLSELIHHFAKRYQNKELSINGQELVNINVRQEGCGGHTSGLENSSQLELIKNKDNIITFTSRVVFTTLYASELTIGYLLMSLIMSYNVIVLVCSVVGVGFGYFISPVFY